MQKKPKIARFGRKKNLRENVQGPSPCNRNITLNKLNEIRPTVFIISKNLKVAAKKSSSHNDIGIM